MCFSGKKVSGEEKEREKERAELSYLLFSEMQSEGVQPNLKLFNSLIELSGFEERRRRASVVDSNNVDGGGGGPSAALGEEEFRLKVLSILTEMQRLGIRPNSKTLKWSAPPLDLTFSSSHHHVAHIVTICLIYIYISMQHIFCVCGGGRGRGVGSGHLRRTAASLCVGSGGDWAGPEECGQGLRGMRRSEKKEKYKKGGRTVLALSF